MPNQEKKQQGLMKIIKAIHNFTVNDDLEKVQTLSGKPRATARDKAK